MCGICGFTGDNNGQVLAKMCKSIEHRGPNDSGVFEDRDISLGNRRLSIIGLGTGHQPVHNEDKTIWVTYNGEIYNHSELADSLRKQGHRFYTDCDTEVIVHAYEQYGEQCVNKFRGMFTFALWDGTKRLLFLARDRFGIKPLYYTVKDGNLVFGSEIKAILQHPSVKATADSEALADFLTLRYVPGSRTFFKGISKLLPGHYLIWKAGTIRISKYWGADFTEDERVTEQAFGSQFADSVKSHLMSEVPLGVFLSGGVDSSSIVAAMSKITKKIETFSIGFGDAGIDETPHARQVAEHFGTNHHEFTVNKDAMKLIPNVVWHMEEPNADPAALPLYVLSQNAKKYVTVVLVGDGGDEVLGGYQHYNFMRLKAKYGTLLQFAKPLVSAVPTAILDKYFMFASALGEKGIERFKAFASAKTPEEAYYLLTAIFTDEEKKELLGSGNSSAERLYKPYFARKPNFTGSQLFDVENWLTHLLNKTDKVTMAHSLEARVPFLDNNFFDLCSRLTADQRLRGSTGKWMLRNAMKDVLPAGLAKRKKQQFFVPTDAWLGGDVKGMANEYLSDDILRKRGYDGRYVNKIVNGYNSSKLYYSRQLWSLITLEVWHRLFIDGQKPR